MVYLLMAVFAALVVFLDQWTKLLTVQNIAPWVCSNTAACAGHIEKLIQAGMLPAGESLPRVLPGVEGIFSLIQVHNTGAAWSSFSGQIWLFAGIFLLFAGFILWEFPKKRMGFTTLERWCIVAVFAGGLGNMIDRLRFGFVIDMIHLDFMNFPVFNVADCFICCGCILLILHLIFWNKPFWKDEK